MSGTYCEGCGQGNLVADPSGKGADPVTCDLCAWKADAALLPRKRLADHAPAWTKRDRKEKGLLFFLWVRFDPDNMDAAFQVMKVLGLRSMHSSASSLIELEKRPSDEQLKRLAAIAGVHEVRLAP
jgi:hypothetical protein